MVLANRRLDLVLELGEQLDRIDVPGHDDVEVVRDVGGRVVIADLLRRQVAQRVHQSTRLGPIAARLRIQQPLRPQLHQIIRPVLPPLHLRVHHARILPLAVDVEDLGREALVRDRRVEQVVDERWQEVEEAGRARRGDSIGRVRVGRPAASVGVVILTTDQALVPDANARLACCCQPGHTEMSQSPECRARPCTGT